MDIRIDDRGKYFTPHVNKEEVPSVVRTADQLIIGTVYVRPDQRLKDELNIDHGRFLAVTNARVYEATGEQLLFATNFLLVSYHQVVMLSPLEAVTNALPPALAQALAKEEG